MGAIFSTALPTIEISTQYSETLFTEWENRHQMQHVLMLLRVQNEIHRDRQTRSENGTEHQNYLQDSKGQNRNNS